MTTLGPGAEFAWAIASGVPLGVGGVPFGADERELAEGTLLALFTAGLVERREQSIEDGLQTRYGCWAAPGLRPANSSPPSVLAGTAPAPEGGEQGHLCDAGPPDREEADDRLLDVPVRVAARPGPPEPAPAAPGRPAVSAMSLSRPAVRSCDQSPS